MKSAYASSRLLVLSVSAAIFLFLLSTPSPVWPCSGSTYFWFNTTGNLNVARSGQRAVLLPNGKVLIVGGASTYNGSQGDDRAKNQKAELYDPDAGSFSTFNLLHSVTFESLTVLANGKVLIAGGLDPYANQYGGDITSSASLYDPATGSVVDTGHLNSPREKHSATLLPNGQVLILGGEDRGGGVIASAELYDPATGTFKLLPDVLKFDSRHTATLLNSGKVLIVESGSSVLFDYNSNTFTTGPNPTYKRYNHTATLLQDGRVLLAGGDSESGDIYGNSVAEFYDPNSNQFVKDPGAMLWDRHFHTATLLPDGKVLIAGGMDKNSEDPYYWRNSNTTEILDPNTGVFSGGPGLTRKRACHTATMLNDGRILIAGGRGPDPDNPNNWDALFDGAEVSTGIFCTMHIMKLVPTSGYPLTTVEIDGVAFGSTKGTVTFNGASAVVTSWTDTRIVATVPGSATSGPVIVSFDGSRSNGVNFTVLPPQKACIPPPTNRVPGLPGPPDWIGTFNPPSKSGLDDPRWDGAGSFTWDNGTSGDTAKFQAISSGGKLFLSWFVELPPQAPLVNGSPDYSVNTVYMGFTQKAATSPTNVAITISLASLGPGSDTADFSSHIFQVDSSGSPSPIPSLSGSTPTWIGNNTRVWINQPANTFAVQMVIPISTAGLNSGLNLDTDFQMWFEMQEALPPATPHTVWDAVFPDGRGGTPTANDVQTVGSAIQYPAPSSWASFHQSSGPGDAACTLGGISITESQIGTYNIDPTTHNPARNEIQFTKTGTNNLINTFFASPTNGMSTTIPSGGITATFRIADWGSTYDPNAPWTTIPGGQDVPSTAPVNAGDTADQNNITFNWVVQDVPGNTWLSDFRNNTKTKDQCMLVELAGGTLKTWQASHMFNLNDTIVDPMGNLQKVATAGTSGALQPTFNDTAGGTTSDNTVTWKNSGPAIGPGLTFLNNSVLTNMDFVGVSKFERRAQINIQGLAPLSSSPRDVYLDVLTANMPGKVDSGWKDRYNSLFGSPANRTSQRTQALLSRMSTAQLNQNLPSYRVLVFHDSGEKIRISGQDFLILHRQSGFGYFALPQGDVTGWAHSLQGASEIAPDFYRISIPNNSIGYVTTTITAMGEGPTPSTGKFAVFLDAGANFPQGTFGNAFKPGFSLNAGLEYMAMKQFSLEGIFGFHHPTAKAAGSLSIYQFSGDAKFYITTGNIRPFINVGVGGYAFSHGSTYFGGNTGGGVLFTINSKWGAQGSYNFHAVNTPVSTTQFSTLQGGIRYVF